MKILAIECTHGFASAAVSNGERVFERLLADWQKTAESLVPLVMQVMEEARLQPTELDGVAVSSGPGSFTALRIGMSVAKGIAFGLGRPLVPVSTMTVMACSVLDQTVTPHIVTAIPSRAEEYHYSIFRREEGIPVEIDNARCQLSELPERLEALAGGFSVAVRSVEELVRLEPSLAPFCVETASFTAASLLSHAAQALATCHDDLVSGVVPDYRQAFVPVRRHS